MHHNKSNGPGTGADIFSPKKRSVHAIAAAVAIVGALTAGNALALALGRVSVQSELGEPLRAEIDVPSISPEEASSLQVGIAPADRFRAANMAFNPLLNEVRFELVQRPNGQFVIRLSSDRIVTEPFLDMVVQASWTSGQLLRGYTMLFDPPNLRPVPAPLLPAAPTPPVVVEVRPAMPVLPPEPAAAPTVAPPLTALRPTVAPLPAETTRRVDVRRGDTASGIAVNQLPPGVSLDQMLIAMLRANPGAFINNNVNRLRAGAILEIPDAAEASAISLGEARQLVQAQSRDFNEFRRRLASMAPAQDAPPATRRAEGVVQAEVVDQQPAATAQDRLTLAQAGTATNETQQIAQARQQDATGQRTEELNRNLQELEQLREAIATTPAAEAPPAVEPTAPPAVPGIAVESATLPTTAPDVVPAPAPVTGSFINNVISHPYALPAGGGLVALLALLGLLRWRRQKVADAVESEQELDNAAYEQAEGQTVDTNEDAPVSSMMYSPSQLDAGGDVDPVAEADVYLAYGRDKQAEEILLEAIRLHPDRLPVRLKLLEIYASRNDAPAFNAAAQDVHALTGGEGEDWEQVRVMGLQVDPDFPLYLAGPLSAAADASPLSAPPDIDLNFDNEPPDRADDADDLDKLLQADPPPTDTDFDLDLTTETPASETQPTEQALDRFDFDLGTGTGNTRTPPAKDVSPSVSDGLDFDLDLTELELDPAPGLPDEIKNLSLDLELDLETAEPSAPTPAAPPAADTDLLDDLEFDENLGGNDPLQTKLSLAEEFDAIGDTDGARSLAEEVEAEASGELKARARAFLARLS